MEEQERVALGHVLGIIGLTLDRLGGNDPGEFASRLAQYGDATEESDPETGRLIEEWAETGLEMAAAVTVVAAH